MMREQQMLFALLRVAPARNRDSYCPGSPEAEKIRGGNLNEKRDDSRAYWVHKTTNFHMKDNFLLLLPRMNQSKGGSLNPLHNE